MFHWTQERSEKLVELRDLGLTAAQIGNQMGVTRNAVIGRLNRIGKGIGYRPPSPWGTYPERNKAICEAYHSGLRCFEIAKRFNVSPCVASNITIKYLPLLEPIPEPQKPVQTAPEIEPLPIPSGPKERWQCRLGTCERTRLRPYEYCQDHVRRAA